MAELIDLYKHLIKIKNPKMKDFWNHLDAALKYIDISMYQKENLIYSYVNNVVNGFSIQMYYAAPLEELKNWEISKVYRYIDDIFDVMTKFFQVRKNIIQHSIFIELKSFVNYFTDGLTKDRDLITREKLSVEQHKFFRQCETYEYMYTFFDKVNYIFHHLNEKYISQTANKTDVRFYADLVEHMLPFAKDDDAKEKIITVIGMVTDSTMWHYIRKLRNRITHDFVDPAKSYNLSYDLKLLYINICRIVFLLDATIKKDDDFRQLIDSLRG